MSNPLFTSDATGATRPATADEILEAARTILAHRVRRGAAISNPRHTRDYLRLHLAPRDHEVFAILFLDNRHRVIEFVPLFRGTVDGASVYPREVVKEALRRNAAAVILAHNHPSGVAEPSQADELITTRIRDALALVDIRVLCRTRSALMQQSSMLLALHCRGSAEASLPRRSRAPPDIQSAGWSHRPHLSRSEISKGHASAVVISIRRYA
jgi:DNA repair protein RadC